jgi:hypothetical protein
LDLTVTSIDGANAWDLIDLLGRSAGCVVEDQGRFTIKPAGHGSETMRPLQNVRFNSLDDALAAIEAQTRCMCRRPDPAT